MGIESITSGAESTIADLDSTLPAGGDLKVEGDDHIRNVKKALQLTWPRLSATVASVASELDFAHMGGTVSGNAIVLGKLECDSFSCSATAVISTRIIAGDAAIAGTLTVSGAAVFVSEARFEKTVTISNMVALNMVAGRFQALGTLVYRSATNLSLAYDSSGHYTVTHNFGTVGYAVSVQTENESSKHAMPLIQAFGANTFQVYLRNPFDSSEINSGLHIQVHRG